MLKCCTGLKISRSIWIDFCVFPLFSVALKIVLENREKQKRFNNHVTRSRYRYNEVRTLEHSPDVISKLFSVKSQPALMTQGLVSLLTVLSDSLLIDLVGWCADGGSEEKFNVYSDDLSVMKQCANWKRSSKLSEFQSRRNIRTSAI